MIQTSKFSKGGSRNSNNSSNNNHSKKRDKWAARRAAENVDLKALYKEGDEVEGTIAAFIKAGASHSDTSAVINLAKGGTALLLFNEIPGYPRHKITDSYKVGDAITTDVTAVRAAKNRVSVSLKAIMLRRTAAQLERGYIVSGQIVSEVAYGYFVAIGGGVEALLHNDNLEIDFHGKKVGFAIGEETEVVVLKIEDQGKRVGVGRRQLFD